MADSQKYGRSANLFDDEIESGFYNDNGELVPDTTTSHSTTYIPVNGTTYAASGLWNSGGTMSNFAVYEWDNDKNWLRRSNRQYPPSSNEITFTIGTDTAYITLQVQTEHDSIMLNTGSTALPYQPYYDWQHSLRKLTTATEAVENPLYSDGTAITNYTIKGNTVQDGTPTPSNPVEVNGVGERTENLFDGSTSATNQRLSTIGTGTYAAQGYSVSSFIEIKPSTYYTLTTGETTYYNLYNENKQYIYGAATNIGIPNSYANARYIRFDFKTENIPSVMLVEGKTVPTSYIPYGYKIPILSGGVTTNIYLGSTQTIRLIKKKILTGDEDWQTQRDQYRNDTALFTLWQNLRKMQNRPSVNTHFISAASGVNPQKQNYVCSGYHPANDYSNYYYIRPSFSTIGITSETSGTAAIAAFKAWLAAQYANGTPVTVWYVLATPETATVNEPLMKIGDYADTVSNAASIPTTEGANTITVDTTVQPSEFTATWTGWHDASVKEWDGSQWNE